MKCSWRPVINGVLQGQHWVQVMTLIMGKSIHSRLADNARQGEAADTPEDCADTQMGLDRLAK